MLIYVYIFIFIFMYFFIYSDLFIFSLIYTDADIVCTVVYIKPPGLDDALRSFRWKQAESSGHSSKGVLQ